MDAQNAGGPTASAETRGRVDLNLASPLPTAERAFDREPEITIEELIDRAGGLVEIVQGYGIALRKRGTEHLGLCPFHADTDPSLNVNAAKQSFVCRACGARGGVLAFIERHEAVERPEAVAKLRRRSPA